MGNSDMREASTTQNDRLVSGGVDLVVPEALNVAEALLDENVAERRGGRPAIYFEDSVLTYGELLDQVNRFGNALRSLGVDIEVRVMMILPDSPEFVISFLGTIKIGAVSIPTNTLLTPRDYGYMLNLARAEALIVDETFRDTIRKIRSDLKHLKHIIVVGETETDQLSFNELLGGSGLSLEAAETHRDDEAFWLWTSGTTGVPQAVVHLHHDPIVTADTYAKPILGIIKEDRCFSASKLFFAYGLDNNLIYPFSVGASSILYSGRPLAEKIFEVIDRYRPTIFYAVPALYNAMLRVDGAENRFNLSSLRLCVSAGEALPAPIYTQWMSRFKIEILDGMGTTETLGMILSNRPGEIKPGSSGIPVHGIEVKIVDVDGRELKRGEDGYLMAKAENATPFYWLNQELTKRRIIGEWIYTGDVYRQDEEGYFWYLGRSSDMIKQGGIWVSPVEVEGALLTHPAVLECAVVGVRDTAGLEKVKAFVVLKNGHQPIEALATEIRKSVKAGIAPFKAPAFIEFVNELPKTATGKTRRFMLREGIH